MFDCQKGNETAGLFSTSNLREQELTGRVSGWLSRKWLDVLTQRTEVYGGASQYTKVADEITRQHPMFEKETLKKN
jgi:hypothetical protein